MTEQTVSRETLHYLQAWRLHRLLTLRQLANLSDVSVTTIHALEHGKAQANMVTVAKLARGLGISRDVLLHQNPEEEPVKTEDVA